MSIEAAATWPKPGVSAAVFRDDSVLLIKRGKPPFLGFWSLPGGSIEPGERALAAAQRELVEETGIEAHLTGLVDVVDVIVAPGGVLAAHFVLAVYVGHWLAGDPHAASDAAEARFVPMSELASVPLTAGQAEVIAKAWGKFNPPGCKEVTT